MENTEKPDVEIGANETLRALALIYKETPIKVAQEILNGNISVVTAYYQLIRIGEQLREEKRS